MKKLDIVLLSVSLIAIFLIEENICAEEVEEKEKSEIRKELKEP